MGATRLRVDITFLAVLALAIGCLSISGTAYAGSDELKDALHDYATGNYEDALTKLRTYVEANPDQEEVYAVLAEAENRVILRAMAKGGEHERLIKYLLDKSKVVESDGMDDAAIKEKADAAVTTQAVADQQRARAELRAAGGRAVPHLYGYLASEDPNEVVGAILALRAINRAAVAALIEVLSSDDAKVRGHAATILGDIGDARAKAAVQHQAMNDADVNAKAKAAAALEKLGGAKASVASAFTWIGNRYYARDITVIRAFDSTKDMWRWEDGALVLYSVPSYLFPYQMAEECAADALAVEPGHMGARSLLVRSLLAQRVEADVLASAGAEAPESLGGVRDLAESQGFEAASAALADCLKTEDWDVAVECCYLIAATYGGEDLRGSPLGHAAAAPQKRVRYAAAIAALLMSPKRGMPNADKIVALGAQAASESAIRQALIIDDNEETRSKILMAMAHSGIQASGSARGTLGVMRARNAPSLDVIVVRADLGDASNTIASERHSSSYMVIDELLADARTKDMKIVVLVQDTAENKADAIKEGFSAKYGESIVGFIDGDIVESVVISTVNAAAEGKDLNPDQERANALAARAADAFAKVDFSCRSFDLTVAIEPLSTAATEGPTPEVRMNATKALGNLTGGGADALLTVLNEGEGDDIRAAAATSLGAVLSATEGTSEQVDGLIAATSVEGAVGKAALAALGKVRNLTPEQRRQVFLQHRLMVGSKGE
jgi:HEAT repeat protein